MRRNIGIAILVVCIWAFVAFKMMNKSHDGGTPTTAAAGDFPGTGSEADWNAAMPLYKEATNEYLSEHFDQALQLVNQAVIKYPSDSNFYNLAALALYHRNQQGDVLAGEGLLKKAIALKPTEAKLWDNLGKGLAMEGKVQDAKDAFEKALQCNPTPEKENEIRQHLGTVEQGAGTATQ